VHTHTYTHSPFNAKRGETAFPILATQRKEEKRIFRRRDLDGDDDGNKIIHIYCSIEQNVFEIPADPPASQPASQPRAIATTSLPSPKNPEVRK
jgi:hypothetical protein